MRARTGAEPHERTLARTTQRNGHRPKLVSTPVGDLEVETRSPSSPKARSSPSCSNTGAGSTGNVVLSTASGPLGTASNPPETTETVGAQGFAAIHSDTKSAESRPERVSQGARRPPPEEAGRLSNPIQRRLSTTEIDELIAAYRSGVTISELADRHGVHRSTVAATFDRHNVERHHAQTTWTSETLADAADLYKSGLSLAAVAARYGIDPQTVANRFRRAGIPVRNRRGWPPRPKGR